jgi:hypothetical protein
MSGAQLLERIAHIRAEIDECERLVREFGGTKDHGRLLANLRETANDLEAAVYRAAREVKGER